MTQRAIVLTVIIGILAIVAFGADADPIAQQMKIVLS